MIYKIFKFALITLVFIFISCKVVLIGKYDSVIDNGLMTIHENLTTHIYELAREKGTEDFDYKNYESFYDDTRAKLNSLKIRSEFSAKTEIIQKQLSFISANIDSLVVIHKRDYNESIGSNFQDELMLNTINSTFKPVLKLQVELKEKDKSN